MTTVKEDFVLLRYQDRGDITIFRDKSMLPEGAEFLKFNTETNMDEYLLKEEQK